MRLKTADKDSGQVWESTAGFPRPAHAAAHTLARVGPSAADEQRICVFVDSVILSSSTDVSDHHAHFQLEHLALTRRELLQRCGMGFGALALGNLIVGAADRGRGRPTRSCPTRRISRPKPSTSSTCS